MRLQPYNGLRGFRGFPAFDNFFDVQRTGSAKRPAIDIRETDDALFLSADVPGMSKDELSVEVHDGVLTLSGERKQEEVTENPGTIRTEKFYGKFTRSFQLPDTVDVDNVEATYVDGVLEIRLSKIEAPKPKTIEIEVK